jgi:low affinity Fe/Cu permease
MKKYLTEKFESMANWTSEYLGKPSAFFLACLSISVWALSGPYFNFSDSYQLVVNTGTTIATFLMMFLLQNTGNRTISELSERLHRMEIQNARILELLESFDEPVHPVSPA